MTRDDRAGHARICAAFAVFAACAVVLVALAAGLAAAASSGMRVAELDHVRRIAVGLLVLGAALASARTARAANTATPIVGGEPAAPGEWPDAVAVPACAAAR